MTPKTLHAAYKATITATDAARRAAQASGKPRTVQPVPGYPAWYIILEV